MTGNQAPAHPNIANEGKLSVIGEQPEDVAHPNMPVLKRYMAQLSILPTVATLLALLLAVLLDSYMNLSRKRSMIVIIVLHSENGRFNTSKKDRLQFEHSWFFSSPMMGTSLLYPTRQSGNQKIRANESGVHKQVV